MPNNDDWMNELDKDDATDIEILKEEEEKKKNSTKQHRPGARGKKPVKRLEVEVGERLGKRGPLVLMYGQGPKPRTSVNVPISAEIRNKLEKKTVGPRGQVCALLIEWALDELAARGKSITATPVK
jgi:hypothetical protein